MYPSNLYTCVPCTGNAGGGVSGLKAVQSVAVFVKLWQAEISIAFQNQKCGNFRDSAWLAMLLVCNDC
jgi:hypothetical protein